MTWQITTYFVSIIITASVMGYITWYSRKQRDTVTGAGVYMWISLLMGLIALFQGLSMIGPSEGWALFWFNMRVVCFALMPVLWLIFVLHYTGKGGLLSKFRIALFLIIPAITQAMLWTKNWHRLWVVRDVTILQAGPYFIADTSARIPGPWMHVHNLYTYGIMLAGVVVLFASSARLYRRYRGQVVALGAGTLVMIGGTLFPSFNLLPGIKLNPMPQGFALGALIIAWGLYRHRFLGVTPRADRERPVPASLVALFSVLILGILAAGFMYYRGYREHYRYEMEQQLSAIANLKTNEIVHWRRERLGDAAVLRGNPAFTSLVRRVISDPADAGALWTLRTWLKNLQAASQYDHIILYDTQGTLRLSVPPAGALACNLIREHSGEVLRTDRVEFLDFHRHEKEEHVHLGILVPVIDNGRAQGIVVLMIDPSRYLFPLLRRWPGASRTAETLLVRRDGDDALFINELKFRKTAPLTMKVPLTEMTVPAVMAVRGREGVVEGIDYRGVPVIAALRHVPDSPWYMVARMDIEEVYAPVRERFWMMTVVVLALIAGAGAGMGILWRRRSARYIEQELEAAENLRESEEKFSRAFMNSPYAITITDPKEGRFVDVNEAFHAITGYARDEAVASSSIALNLWVKEEDRKHVVQELMDGKEVVGREFTFRKKNGGVITGLFSADFIDLKAGRFVLSSISDITDRKRIENGMRSAMNLTEYASIFSGDDLLRKTLDEAELLTGSCIGFLHFLEKDQKTLSLQMWSTNTIETMCTAEGKGNHYDIGRAGVWVDCVRERRQVIHNDYASLPGRKGLPEGHAPVVRELVVPVMRNNLVVAILGVGNKPSEYDAGDAEVVSLLADKAWDIIDRKRAEEAVMRERDFVKGTTNSLPGLFYLFDETGKFISWNDNFERVSGYSAGEISRMSPLDFFDSPGRELIAERIGECFTAGEAVAEADFISKDGTRTPLFFTGKLFIFDGIPCLIGMGIDISDRIKAEEALRESERRLYLAIASSPIPIMIHDEEDRVLQLSTGWTKLSGYTLEDIPTLADWTELAYGERSGTGKKYIDELFSISETVYNGEWQVKAKNGETRVWDFQTTPLGRVSRGSRVLLSMATDITDRKRAEDERRRFTEELERSNEDLQQFAYVASHDLQEPLRMITSYLQLIARRYKDKLDADADDFIGFAVDGASRLQTLISGLLEFSRVKTHGSTFEQVDVKEVLETILANLKLKIDEFGAGIVYDDMPVISADRSQITRLFQNLVQNAIKFKREGTPPRIRISAEKKGEEHVFCVEDNGIGIEAQYFERIFTIFQRLHTREEFPGTGIGLSICKRIVERHGGRIWVESEYGEGSSFYFSIPAPQPPGGVKPPNPPEG